MFKIFKLFVNKGLSATKGFFSNFCVTTIGNSGNVYGYIKDSFGEATPSINIINQPLYQSTWNVDGMFIVSFGVTGNEQVPDVPQIIMWHESQTEAIVLPWNATTTQYEGTDLVLATYLTNQVTVNGLTKTCFLALIKPVLFIRLTMGKMI